MLLSYVFFLLRFFLLRFLLLFDFGGLPPRSTTAFFKRRLAAGATTCFMPCFCCQEILYWSTGPGTCVETQTLLNPLLPR